MRQIVLDTETTGLETSQGHRIIEIGCVELHNRKLTGRTYHQYINPERDIDEGAMAVHGISNDFLADKPVFNDIAQAFMEYVDGADLIIHNAPFDIGFINYELSLLERSFEPIDQHSHIIDSLQIARHKHPGQSNKLDALCKRYAIDNSHRTLHGALLDSEILADVYLAMTGGQVRLHLGGTEQDDSGMPSSEKIRRLNSERAPLKVLTANSEERAAHDEFLKLLNPS